MGAFRDALRILYPAYRDPPRVPADHWVGTACGAFAITGSGKARSGRWFWALKSITREDPVPAGDRGSTPKMVDAWLSWGKQKGYQW
jgi:hypothetical protein